MPGLRSSSIEVMGGGTAALGAKARWEELPTLAQWADDYFGALAAKRGTSRARLPTGYSMTVAARQRWMMLPPAHTHIGREGTFPLADAFVGNVGVPDPVARAASLSDRGQLGGLSSPRLPGMVWPLCHPQFAQTAAGEADPRVEWKTLYQGRPGRIVAEVQLPLELRSSPSTGHLERCFVVLHSTDGRAVWGGDSESGAGAVGSIAGGGGAEADAYSLIIARGPAVSIHSAWKCYSSLSGGGAPDWALWVAAAVVIAVSAIVTVGVAGVVAAAAGAALAGTLTTSAALAAAAAAGGGALWALVASELRAKLEAAAESDEGLLTESQAEAADAWGRSLAATLERDAAAEGA